MSSDTDAAGTRELSERVQKLEQLVARLGLENLSLLLLLQGFFDREGLDYASGIGEDGAKSLSMHLDGIFQGVDDVISQALHDD